MYHHQQGMSSPLFVLVFILHFINFRYIKLTIIYLKLYTLDAINNREKLYQHHYLRHTKSNYAHWSKSLSNSKILHHLASDFASNS